MAVATHKRSPDDEQKVEPINLGSDASATVCLMFEEIV
jgi:hypothetical protein